MEGGKEKETEYGDREEANSVLVTCCILHKLTQVDETPMKLVYY